ncbi:hypothetical protein DCAR_0105023 [Daucus carota subsp. sativus]|uniref:Uncharacterized protein n=1 Tax=Daucus carota subsp. sativus TaxID=79200 RepID=A0AAF1AMV3_DAUCS|nr:PREDICTED: uncharacterized protein LOC108223794 [Daucus carota subsp. sativus]WOG85830.1 hypothetical protein DCAR_0105023 [Daucus carota subsp. sativus]
MAPKIEKSQPKDKGKRRDFDPRRLGKDDRFVFNLRFDDQHLIYNFITFIVQLRYFAACGGERFIREKLDYKLCLGDDKSYKNLFMIVAFYFEGGYGIDFLIYKPNVYNVGFFIENKWYVVKDFSDLTHHKFTKSEELKYDSSYRLGCPTHFSLIVFKESIINVFNSRDEKSFRNLCVILCETMRSDEILRVISKSLGMNNGEPRQVTLNRRQLDTILNWGHTSGVWYLYDLGFEWDPLRLYTQLGLRDAKECSASLGLALKMDQKFEFYIDKLRALDEHKRRQTQRRPIDDIKGFITTEKWQKMEVMDKLEDDI